jgi:hypothetical protein
MQMPRRPNPWEIYMTREQFAPCLEEATWRIYGMSYIRFGAMIATSTVAMFALMYLNTYALDHVCRLCRSRHKRHYADARIMPM